MLQREVLFDCPRAKGLPPPKGRSDVRHQLYGRVMSRLEWDIEMEEHDSVFLALTHGPKSNFALPDSQGIRDLFSRRGMDGNFGSQEHQSTPKGPSARPTNLPAISAWLVTVDKEMPSHEGIIP